VFTSQGLNRRHFLKLFGSSALGLLAASGARGDLLQRLQNQAAQDAARPRPGAQKLHLILTGYTRADACGRACARDCAAMGNSFRNARLGNQLQIHNLTGNAWTAPAVMNYLTRSTALQEVGPRQVVCFYHSGHGEGLEPGDGEEAHRLVLNDHRSLNRRAVRLALERRHPYGVMLLTDCCSGTAAQDEGSSEVEGRDLRAPNATTIRQLFLIRPRLINITACQPGTLGAFVHAPQYDGFSAQSAFTVALFQLLYAQRAYTSWNALFPALQRMSQLVSTFPGNQPQVPYVFGRLVETNGAAPSGSTPAGPIHGIHELVPSGANEE
jgi:hypothetical protein